jgi:S-ribosylhomocysteine lyase LuxS involved in autoinducer biosynthesis
MKIKGKGPSSCSVRALNGVGDGTMTEKDLRFCEPNADDLPPRFALT